MIDSLNKAQQVLNEMIERYYSEEEFSLDLDCADFQKTCSLQITCKTDHISFPPNRIYLPILQEEFEEEVARVVDNAIYLLQPDINSNDIEIEGL